MVLKVYKKFVRIEGGVGPRLCDTLRLCVKRNRNQQRQGKNHSPGLNR